MFGNNMKKLIIVCDNKTEEYANLLRQLISSKDDTENEVVGIEDGTVGVVVWLEKNIEIIWQLFLQTNTYFF